MRVGRIIVSQRLDNGKDRKRSNSTLADDEHELTDHQELHSYPHS